jgi:hypothetical protein
MLIQLQPHVGKRLSDSVQIDLKQDRIFVDGQHVGYLARVPDAPINLVVRDLPEATSAAIRQAVQSKYGGAALKLVVPPEVPEDEAADDDYDEYDE